MRKPRHFKPSIDRALSWQSQAEQYPEWGPPGIGYHPGLVPGVTVVDCLLYRDDKGYVIGILNYFSDDVPPYERAGNVNIFVHPDHRRKGIATALWREAERRWHVTLDTQRFTRAGAKLAEAISKEDYP